MSTRKHEADRGLHAVARVRQVRERDSRVGLQQALSTAQRDERTAAAVLVALENAPVFAEGSTADFVAERRLLSGMATRLRLAQEQAATSQILADQARVHWQSAKTRLRAVDYLLEKRTEARQAEVARKVAHELDDIAGQMWIRRRASEAVVST